MKSNLRRSRILPVCAMLVFCIIFLISCGGGNTKAVSSTPVEKTVAPVEKAVPAAEPDREIAVEEPAPTGVIAAITTGNSVRVSWLGAPAGDFNSDGEVSGADVFPLALHFGEAVDDMEGNECIDGNGDGTLNGLDLFTISANFMKRVDGWNIYAADSEGGPFTTKLNDDPIINYGCGTLPTWYDVVPPLPRWYTVTAWDEEEMQESPQSPSTPATADTTVPYYEGEGGITSVTGYSANGVTVGWEEAFDPERLSVSYTIYWDTEWPIRYDSGAQSMQVPYPVTGLRDDLMYGVSGLAPGIDYYFGVRASDGANPPNMETNTFGIQYTLNDWQYNMIDDSTDVDPNHASIDSNTDGLRVVSYLDKENWNLRVGYAYQLGDWTTEVLDDEGTVGQHNSVRIDSMGGAHVSYHDMALGNLKYAYNPDPTVAGGWNTENLDGSMDNRGAWTSLDIDEMDRPGVSYVDLDNWKVMFAWKLSGGVSIEPVADLNADPALEESATVLQFNIGRPSILFREPLNGYLYLSTRDSADPEAPGTWTTQGIATGEAHRYPTYRVPDDNDDPEGYGWRVMLFNDVSYGITISQKTSENWWRIDDIVTLSSYVLGQDLEVTKRGSFLRTFQHPSGALNINFAKVGATGSAVDNYDGFQAGAAGFDTYLSRNKWDEGIKFDAGAAIVDTEGDFVEPRRYFIGSRLRF